MIQLASVFWIIWLLGLDSIINGDYGLMFEFSLIILWCWLMVI